MDLSRRGGCKVWAGRSLKPLEAPLQTHQKIVGRRGPQVPRHQRCESCRFCGQPEGSRQLILGQPDALFARNLPGPPQPRAACGTGALLAPDSPAGFGAFALLDGPGLTQFRV